MTKEEETEMLVDMYISEKRDFAKCPFLRPPKRGSKEWKCFERAVDIIHELQGEVSDYLRYQIIALSSLHLFPSPSHLSSDRARDRYRIHLNAKGISNTPFYYLAGNSFTVKASFIEYPLSDVKLPFDRDPKTVSVQMISRDKPKLLPDEINKLLDNIDYYIAKCAYHTQLIPSWVRELREEYGNIAKQESSI